MKLLRQRIGGFNLGREFIDARRSLVMIDGVQVVDLGGQNIRLDRHLIICIYHLRLHRSNACLKVGQFTDCRGNRLRSGGDDRLRSPLAQIAEAKIGYHRVGHRQLLHGWLVGSDRCIDELGGRYPAASRLARRRRPIAGPSGSRE